MLHFRDFLIKVELLNNVNYIFGEVVEVAAEVVGDVVGISQQAFKSEERGVVEVETCSITQESVIHCQLAFHCI